MQFVQLRRLDAAAHHRLRYTAFQSLTSPCLNFWFYTQIRKLRLMCPWQKVCENYAQKSYLQKCPTNMSPVFDTSPLVLLVLTWMSSQMLKTMKKRNRRNKLGAWMCEIFTAGISSEFNLSQLMWLSSWPGRDSVERRSQLCKRQWRNASDTSWPSSLMSKVNLIR